MRELTIFIIAGEISGDLLGADLAAHLRYLRPDAALVGIGGARMSAAGVRCLMDSTTWGVVGHVDPVLRLRTYLRRLREVTDAVRRERPDVLVLIDFPAFNLRVAERLKGRVPVAYYAPPLVSVRRGDRARKVAHLRMRLLATLRPEADAYAAAGADVTFVGHPAADLPRQAPERDQARRMLGLPAQDPVVGLLPGSRLQEVRAHLPVMLRAAAIAAGTDPRIAFVLPVPAKPIRQAVERLADGHRPGVRVTDEIYAAMRAADVLLTAAGTATLEAAVLGVPMIVVYRLPALSWYIARRLVAVRHAALPNILAGREIVPELLQDRFTASAAAAAVLRLLRDPVGREAMRAGLRSVAATLGPPGAARRAAEEVLRLGAFVAPAAGGR
ncbi:MAG: lipid-A-disaccharide synthase [Armatimonadota bacterium]|nr:lipid-A-disaccharide synthase [Armatimonadota bacterium]MDR7451354.1 lipid-A-disaccharide synthase [Armatimonadota bacterium]MDR7466496.1 lipid-A-disaccharide synthase [Armatimonadota bacterium]MDR7493218.1 lipid-A-disaccharide synthase [Armatimonadota bacterium]MDR7499429.1 lipid-A-disaccharide synthase [Armatimonadota bacterium]